MVTNSIKTLKKTHKTKFQDFCGGPEVLIILEGVPTPMGTHDWL